MQASDDESNNDDSSGHSTVIMEEHSVINMPNPPAVRCELILEGGVLYVRHIEGDGLLLNGQSLNSKTDMDDGSSGLVKLSFKDSLGLSWNEKWLYELNVDCKTDGFPPGKVIEPQEYSEDEEESEDYDTEDGGEEEECLVPVVNPSVYRALLGNNNEATVLLPKILGYLPFDDLKNARLVCKKWNIRSRQNFLDQSIVSLQAPPGSLEWEKELQEYSHTCLTGNRLSAYGHTNFRICYSGHPADGFLEEDVLAFVKNVGHTFNTLQMTVMPGRNDFAFLRDVLTLSTLDNLENLSLTVVSNDSDYTNKYFPEGIVVPSVKNLSLNFGFEDNVPHHLLKFAPIFVKCFPNLVKLELATDEDDFIKECELERKVFEQIIVEKQGITVGKVVSFQNLNQVHLQSTNAAVLDLLIDFPNLLSVINIHVDGWDTSRIQNLVDKHASALEEFVLVVHREVVGKGEPLFEFPTCPVLKKLSYTFYWDGDEEEEGLGTCDIDLFNVRGLFLEGPDAFKNRFPQLYSIHLTFSCDVELISQILPEENKNADAGLLQFPQITKFRLMYPSSDLPSVPLTCRIGKMFPNVCELKKGAHDLILFSHEAEL